MSVKLSEANREILLGLVDWIDDNGETDDVAELDGLMDQYNISPSEIEDGEFEYAYDFEDVAEFMKSVQSIVDYIKTR